MYAVFWIVLIILLRNLAVNLKTVDVSFLFIPNH